jgi:hypothetical protein
MKDNIYMHGIGYNTIHGAYCTDYSPKRQRSALYEVLDSKYLLSRRLLGLSDSYGFNGMDYISLCDYEKRKEYSDKSSAYNSYIVNSVSLCFDKDKVEEKIIKPTLIDKVPLDAKGLDLMKTYGLNEGERFSDLPDEVQVKDKISLSSLCGITFPTHLFLNYYFFRSDKKRVKKLLDEICELQSIISYLGYDVSIYDINTMEELNNDSINKLVLKR